MEENLSAPVEWQDYESVSMDITWFDNNTKVMVKQKLYNNKKGANSRSLYHSELKYTNPNTGNAGINVNITLNTVCIIKQFREVNGYKADIHMKSVHLYKLYSAIESMYNLISENYDKMFGKNENSIVLLKKLKPIQVDCLFGSFILVEPAVIPGDNPTGGIRICLDSVENTILMDLDKALEMIVELKNIRLHELGLQLVREMESRATGCNRLDMKRDSKPRGGYFHQ